ncbi:MAG TPA: VOC family protein, partial [Cyclobacteriaceae bacterium]|nr:VOC family protein [Cyclobacteriaceae bacterium]
MKVIGIDGIYFASKDPEGLKAWYRKHLGVGPDFYGNELHDPQQPFRTAWMPVKSNDKKYLPPKKSFAFAYRVDDLKALIASLSAKDIKTAAMEEIEGKKLSHAFDPEGNKIMLSQTTDMIKQPKITPATRVTGLGGVFFKALDSKGLGAWYKEN